MAAFMRQAVEETLTSHPGVTMELGRILGPGTTFPVLWKPPCSCQASGRNGRTSYLAWSAPWRMNHWRKLASLADQAGQVRDEPGE